MTTTLTTEQRAIIEAARTGASVTVTAGAGSGKTFVCTKVADALAPAPVLYLTFNKRNADEAQAKMPGNVTAKTFHSLAFGAFGVQYKARMNGGKISSVHIAQMLRIEPLTVKLTATTEKRPILRATSRVNDPWCPQARSAK